MARLRRTGKRSHSFHGQLATELEALAICQLACTEDEDDRFIGLAIAVLALAEKKRARSNRYGLRGSYNQPKSEDFLDILVYNGSERHFQAWFRILQNALVLQATRHITSSAMPASNKLEE
ncbi:uncharacterized protein F5147DRAFT_770403 [Suillus discolor]|uniref:Uncharacterized protein n=1 Tax=Suillus discolor TaxID=1912936 RepID=A0A9P7FC10_9AGAM|nr:uncharacterized protein F5147DRAFT_770403 [Suillus discolor]KAG2113767.1 hypothetical protein F5147DRAFT_770403 [Suillus discolor]